MTKENSFETKFPSLKDRTCRAMINAETNEPEIFFVDSADIYDDYEPVIHQSDIEKHCLEKVKVIEAIENIQGHGDCASCIKQLLKELRLRE